jgi:hypothetical protein
MDYFKLTRAFWDFAFENPEKIKPNHCALYLFIVEHCNRLGWKHKFGLPTTMAKDAIGIRSYNTYIVTLNDLIDFGLIDIIERSKNQYSSNIVAISNFDKALDKALDKAMIKHSTKQSESTVQSIDSIIKQETNIQDTIYEKDFLELFNKCRNHYDKMNTNLNSLNPVERSLLNTNNKNFDRQYFIDALNGFYSQKNMYPSVRIRPKHFLENIELYYSCFHDKKQLFNNKENKIDKL